MKSNKRNNNGISLIVLVITIIIMIILAGAIILSLNSSGVIGKANKAKTDNDVANIKEAVGVIYADYTINETLGNEAEDINQYVKNKLKEKGIAKELINRVYVAEDGKTSVARIPEGFVVSSLETEDEATEGLVIYQGTEPVTSVDNDNNGIIDAQETRNQFVWIPVPDMSNFVRRAGYENGNLQSLDSAYHEPHTTKEEDPTGEYAEYMAMYESVEKYGGFYIARYEGGNDEVGEKLVSKKGAEVWKGMWGNNHLSIGTTGAVAKARSMYEKNNSFKSHVIYGVEWDAALKYISDKVNIKNSRGWGNYSDYNSYVDESKQVEGAGELKTTGYSEYWKAKNIYDMAGNITDITMETRHSNFRVGRGGAYFNGGLHRPASGRVQFKIGEEAAGVRVALYLK